MTPSTKWLGHDPFKIKIVGSNPRGVTKENKMSRSYKKNPYHTDGSPGTTQESKKFVNKKVRNTEDLPNGSAYKKNF